jgi:hypothetical protein
VVGIDLLYLTRCRHMKQYWIRLTSNIVRKIYKIIIVCSTLSIHGSLCYERQLYFYVNYLWIMVLPEN